LPCAKGSRRRGELGRARTLLTPEERQPIGLNGTRNREMDDIECFCEILSPIAYDPVARKG
jgi:hypothetical protein